MTGENVGFANLFTNGVGHTVIGCHCIINKQALCAKVGLTALQEVMQTVSKVTSCISAWALHERHFQVLLMEVELV